MHTVIVIAVGFGVLGICASCRTVAWRQLFNRKPADRTLGFYGIHIPFAYPAGNAEHVSFEVRPLDCDCLPDTHPRCRQRKHESCIRLFQFSGNRRDLLRSQNRAGHFPSASLLRQSNASTRIIFEPAAIPCPSQRETQYDSNAAKGAAAVVLRLICQECLNVLPNAGRT